MNVAFRSAAIGGFNREDVMGYIERTVREHKAALEQANAETAAAEERAEELARLNAELKEQAAAQQEALKAQRDELLTQLEQVRNERDGLQERFDQLDMMDVEERFRSMKNTIEEKENETEQLRRSGEEKDAALAAKEREIEALKGRAEEQESEAASYRTMVSSIGQIEMDMRLRTTLMEQDAQKKTDEQLAETQEQCETMRRQAEEEAEAILDGAKQQAQALRQQMDEKLAAFCSDISQAAERVNSSVTRAMEENAQVQALLEELNGCLDEHRQAAEAISVMQKESCESDETEACPV